MATHEHEESVLYYVAMKHDTGPRSWQKDRVFGIQEATEEPGRLGLEHTDEMEASGGVRSSSVLEKAGYMGRFVSQTKYLIYNMSYANEVGIMSVFLEMRNLFIPQAQS